MFAAQTFGVTPDLICCGKGLSSGMLPIGAMIAREDMAEAFWGNAEDDVQFAHGHTFAGNPLACAVESRWWTRSWRRSWTSKRGKWAFTLPASSEELEEIRRRPRSPRQRHSAGVELVKDTADHGALPGIGQCA